MKSVSWKEKFFECKKIGDEPPLNKEGFWKKRETKVIDIEPPDRDKSRR